MDKKGALNNILETRVSYARLAFGIPECTDLIWHDVLLNARY